MSASATVEYASCKYSRARKNLVFKLQASRMYSLTDHLNSPFRHHVPQLILGMSSLVVPPEARHRNTCPWRVLNSSPTYVIHKVSVRILIRRFIGFPSHWPCLCQRWVSESGRAGSDGYLMVIVVAIALYEHGLGAHLPGSTKAGAVRTGLCPA